MTEVSDTLQTAALVNADGIVYISVFTIKSFIYLRAIIRLTFNNRAVTGSWFVVLFSKRQFRFNNVLQTGER